MPDPDPTPDTWSVEQEVEHARAKVYRVLKRSCRHRGDDRRTDFYVVDSRDWVNCVALTPRREVVMVRQFRFGILDHCWETPGGIIDPGEDPVQAAVRELAEETGYVGRDARIIGSIRPNPAIMTNTCTFVRVDDAHPEAALDWDANEEIETRLVPVREALRWAVDGTVQHALAMNALHFLQASLGNDV
ncbi:MAG: NUDIX hydrolase [Opitutales bacterium]